MTNDFNDMIYLFSCGARGIEPQLKREINVVNIYELSLLQDIWPTVFIALKQLYDQGKVHIDKFLFEKWKIEIMQLVINATNRNVQIHKTIEYLSKNNIKSCVLKGEAVARLYKNPTCRISTDTDILINKKDERRAKRLLKKYGYKVERRPEKLHHINCYHPVAGHLEMHVSMYSDIIDDIFLNNKIQYIEEYIKVKNDEGKDITTLGINDGLIYVTIHFIKHFINKGAGVRQLMDLLLYISYYKNEIDWDRFRNTMNYLKYNKLFNHLLGIGVKYFNFKPEELPPYEYDEDIAEKILTDIEEGGIFGHISKERTNFYSLYIKERYGRFKTGDFIKYMNQMERKDIIYKFFPQLKTMAKTYPYVKKSSLLLPVAWVHRLIKLTLDVITKRKPIGKYFSYVQPEIDNDAVKKRMELIRKLNMI